jgi:metal-responsive CopG/Arc/MetJ family transcriptional regulator
MSKTPKPEKPTPVCFIIEKTYLDKVDAIATANGVNRSEFFRAALFKEIAIQEAVLASRVNPALLGSSYYVYVPKPKVDKLKVEKMKQLLDSLSK